MRHKNKKAIILSAVMLGSAILPYGFVGAEGIIDPIVVSEDTELTLSGNTIDARSLLMTPAIDIKPGATLTLTLEGDNYIYGGACAAGIHVSPAYGGDDNETYLSDNVGKLIIKGSGNLTVIGGRADDEGDSVDVEVGGVTKNVPVQCGSGAGIGGNGSYTYYDGRIDKITDFAYAPDFGNIVIDESYTGNLNANSGVYDDSESGSHESTTSYGSGAGIGTGGTIDFTTRDRERRFSEASHPTLYGSIEINNGNITASGFSENDVVDSDGGAGIGTGGAHHEWINNFSEVSVTINGGNITAKGGYYAAGIGGGANQNSGHITINGGTINAQSGPVDLSGGIISTGGAGIGAGDCAGLQDVTITGGDITAIGHAGAGIGGGYGASENSSIYTEEGELQYIDYPSLRAKINISGANTKVLAISEDGGGEAGSDSRVWSGAGIGSGAARVYSSQSSNDYYVKYQPMGYDISITNGANVTAFGGTYANGIGNGGTYREDAGGVYHNTDVTLTLDDTITLFASNGSKDIPAVVMEDDGEYAPTSYFDPAPLKYSSDANYLVEHYGDWVFANLSTNPWDDDLDAEYSLDGTTMSVSVDNGDATTHEVTNRYVNGNSFALISATPKVEYCKITIMHLDEESGEALADDEGTGDDAVCGEASISIKALDSILSQGYTFSMATDVNGEAIAELPFELSNNLEEQAYKVYYKKKAPAPQPTPKPEPTPEPAPETETPNTADTILEIAPFALLSLVGIAASALAIRKTRR